MAPASAGAAPRRVRRPSALSLYAGGTAVCGVLVLLAVVRSAPPWAALTAHPLTLGSLALALVIGELVAVPVARGDSTTTTVTISTTFAVAMVVLGPLSLVLLVHVVAVVLDDVRARRRLIQVGFNSGQYVLSLVAGRAAFSAVTGWPLLGESSPSPSRLLLGALCAGAVFALVNDSQVAVVGALVSRRPVRSLLLADLRFRLETDGVLVALAPVAALLAQQSVALLVPLLLPVLAVRRTAHLAALREHQSLHDPLTGLANRELFHRRLTDAVAGQRDHGVAVLMVDLDHFKDVNDTLGHHVGDELLREVAARITATCRGGRGVTVARLGGDEFALVLVDDDPGEAAAAVAARLLDRFAEPVDVHGTRLAVQASIGITTSAAGPLPGAHGALQQADIALYEAKEERARASTFSPGGSSASTERMQLLPELREAVEQRRLQVVYQPQVDARTGRVVAVEALVRWQHPTRGTLEAGEFIGLAESTGLVTAITSLVLGEALAAAAAWRRCGHDVRLAVNLSTRQLSDLDLPATVGDLLARAGLAPSALTLEVTENSLMSDPRSARTVLAMLRETGVELSIDDFGTGWSSLVLLQQLDVDELKVDRSFVTGLVPGGHDEVLVRSIVELGHNLGLRVVAEGVETAADAEALRRLGCDLLQGHWFGRPVPADAVRDLLAAQEPGPHPTPLPAAAP